MNIHAEINQKQIQRNLMLADWFDKNHNESLLNPKSSTYAAQTAENGPAQDYNSLKISSQLPSDTKSCMQHYHRSSPVSAVSPSFLSITNRVH